MKAANPLNPILTWLKAGNLTSDGFANQVVALVSANPDLLPELVEGLQATDPAIRGHTADAIEKLARAYPAAVAGFLSDLTRAAVDDSVPMVRWHMAMVCGHLSIFGEHVPALAETLFFLLREGTVITKCWAIASLCILARQYPELVERTVTAIAALEPSTSAALRVRVQKGISLLTNPKAYFPKGWVKSAVVASAIDNFPMQI